MVSQPATLFHQAWQQHQQLSKGCTFVRLQQRLWTHVIDSASLNSLLNKILTEEEQAEVQRNQAQTPDGRYPCRVPGRPKTFRYDGKSRRKHELTHDVQVELSNEPPSDAHDKLRLLNQKPLKSQTRQMMTCSIINVLSLIMACYI